MRVGVICNHRIGVPSVLSLVQGGRLAGLAVSDRVTDTTPMMRQVAQTYHLPFAELGRDRLHAGLSEWLGRCGADVVFVFGFSYRLPVEVLAGLTGGAFNVHGGALPAFRGPDPCFWQIRDGAPSAKLTIHRITDEFDQGAVVHALDVPIGADDTHGALVSNLGAAAVQAVRAVLSALSDGLLESTPQPEADAAYRPKPGPLDLSVRWAEQSAAHVHALVRAANPVYGGAMAFRAGVPIGLLQTTPTGRICSPDVVPGTVVDGGDAHVYVACECERALRIDVIGLIEGVFSGERVRRVGALAPGERFDLYPPDPL